MIQGSLSWDIMVGVCLVIGVPMFLFTTFWVWLCVLDTWVVNYKKNDWLARFVGVFMLVTWLIEVAILLHALGL